MKKVRSIDTLPLDGGALCFNFINTVYAWRGVNLHEYLSSYQDVIKWCKKSGNLNAVQRAALLKEASSHPAKAEKALKQLKETRELLYHFFSAIAADGFKQMPADILSGFNTELAGSFSRLGFNVTRQHIELEWRNPGNDLLQPAWAVIKSAYDILTLEDRSRVKECSACGWIFIDTTKNNKRRWCNPVSCGSTEKSKRYYQKTKKQRLSQPPKEPL